MFSRFKVRKLSRPRESQRTTNAAIANIFLLSPSSRRNNSLIPKSYYEFSFNATTRSFSSSFHPTQPLQIKVELLSFGSDDTKIKNGIIKQILPVGTTVQQGDVIAMIQTTKSTSAGDNNNIDNDDNDSDSNKEHEQIPMYAPHTGRITEHYCTVDQPINIGDNMLDIDDTIIKDIKQLQQEIQKNNGKLSNEYIQSLLELDDTFRLQMIVQNIPQQSLQHQDTKILTVYEHILELQKDTPLESSKTYTQLAVIMYNLNGIEMAIQYLQKALQLRQTTLGNDNSQIAATHIHLGALYRQIGDMQNSLQHMLNALRIQKQSLGDNHPIVASSHNNVGALYYQMMDFHNAINEYEKALQIHLKNHNGNDDHEEENSKTQNNPDIAGTYHNLGIAWKHVGDFNKAQEFLQQALQIRKELSKKSTSTGSDVPTITRDVAASHTALGQLYAETTNFIAAMEQYEAALSIQKEVFGLESPITAIGYNNIGAVYYQQGNYVDALQIYQTGLDILSNVQPNHTDTATSYNNVGLTYLKMGQLDKALEQHQQAHEILSSIYGSDHPNLATTIGSIGNIYKAKEEWEKALKEFELAHVMLESALGTTNHPDVASSFNNLGLVLSQLPNRQNDALDKYRLACTSFQNTLGNEHPHVGSCHFNIGLMLYNQGNNDDAKEEFKNAKQIWENTLGPTHEHTIMAQQSIDECR